MKTIAMLTCLIVLAGGCTSESDDAKTKPLTYAMENQRNFDMVALGDLVVTLDVSHKDLVLNDLLALRLTISNVGMHPIDLPSQTNSPFHFNIYKRAGKTLVLIESYPKSTEPVKRNRTIAPGLPMPFNYTIHVPDTWPVGEPLVIEGVIEGAEGINPAVVVYVHKRR